jgi:hypothetical protein
MKFVMFSTKRLLTDFELCKEIKATQEDEWIIVIVALDCFG